MNHPPEEKANKVQHNQRTLKQLQDLLQQGGYCIYVAPSGGRDRPNKEGKFDVAPFDPQSIELFWLMARHSAAETHFYPLTLKTYPLMPPPSHVEKELGEKRVIHISPVYLAFGKEIDMVHFPGSENGDKRTKRTKRADYIWNLVKKNIMDSPNIIHWISFNLIIAILLTIDLWKSYRNPHPIKVKEALLFHAGWITLALLFNLWIYFTFGSKHAFDFLTGYYLKNRSVSTTSLFSS